jgi:hypothetical protein
MDIMAVAALDQAFVHSMVIRLREVGLRGCMTSVAEGGLCPNEEMLRFFGMMRRVAVQAPNIVARVRRPREVPLFMFCTVATQATGIGILFRHRLETNDLAHIAAAFHVRGSGTVTGLTTVSVVQRCLEMRCGFEVLFVQVFMTGLASVNSDILRCPLLRRDTAAFLRGDKGWSNQSQQHGRSRNRTQELFALSSGLHGRTPHFVTSTAVSHFATVGTGTPRASSIWITVQPI